MLYIVLKTINPYDDVEDLEDFYDELEISMDVLPSSSSSIIKYHSMDGKKSSSCSRWIV